MDLLKERPYLLWVAMFLASLVIGLALYFIFPPRQTERVLFFPENITGKTHGESRLVPRERGREDAIVEVVDEILLGPTRLRDLPLVPADTRLDFLMLRGDTVYIDFSPELVVGSDSVQESVPRILEIVRHTIFYNFPYVRQISITIGGQLPGQPYFIVANKNT